MNTTTTTRRLTGPMSKRLRTARENAGLSRLALHELTDISERAIANYEDPTYNRRRKASFVRSWATATNVPFEQLWGTRERPMSRSGWLGGSRESDRWVA